MEYLPELKSVYVGAKAPGRGWKSSSRFGARPGKYLRLAVFFATCCAALTAAFWFATGDPAGAALAGVLLALGITVFAALFLGYSRLSDLMGRGGADLSPQQCVVAFDLLAALVDTMPANFVVKDRNHRYILINRTMGEWFGWDPADVVGKTFEEVNWSQVYAEENAKIREQDEYVLTTGNTAERFFDVERADGKWIKILSKRFPIRSAAGEIVAVGVTNVDVTELEQTRHEYEEALRERDRQTAVFRNFFEALPFPAAMKGTDGRFLNVNSQLLRWHTFPADEIVGKTIEEVLGPETAKLSVELDEHVLRTNEPTYAEHKLRFFDGVERITSIHRFPILNDEGEMLGLGLFNIDVTEQRAAERLLKDANTELERLVSERTAELEQTNTELSRALEELKATTDLLIESDRMASLGSMVAGMAHEINTPIGIGVTSASLVRDKVEQLKNAVGEGTLTRDGMADAMAVIDEASAVMLRNMARADALIRSLKQVATDQTNMETRNVDLEHYIREVGLSVAPVLNKAGITLDLACDPGLVVTLQPGPLAQVLTNILMNCAQHAYPEEAGGRVLVETQSTDKGVDIRIRDFGLGMDQETAGQVFVPFFTTRRNQGGTGLGLSIVYNVVRSVLGGNISCRSEPGEGTVFTVSLPRNCLVDQGA